LNPINGYGRLCMAIMRLRDSDVDGRELWKWLKML
jgi:hypothetical protein